MTCIAAVVDGTTVHMGADSQGSSGWSRTHFADPKIFRNHEFLIGVAGNHRVNQLLRYAFTPPEFKDGEIEAFISTQFVDAVRACLKAGGLATRKDEAESMTGTTILIGFRGRVICLQDNYQISMNLDGYDVIGAGEDPALGALYAIRQLKATPRQRLEIALAAAEHYNSSVSRPFHFETLEWTPP